MPLIILKTPAKPGVTSLPQTLQTCLDKMLRAEMAHPSPDGRRELCDARQKLHAALVTLARDGRTVDALRARHRADLHDEGKRLDYERAGDRRIKALEYALAVARDCDHVRRGWEETTAVNDNGGHS